MRRGIKKKIVRVTALFLMVCMMPQEPLEIRADNNNLTNSYIQQKEDQIAQIQREQEQLEQGITDSKAILNRLQGQQNDLADYVEQMDAALLDIESNIIDLNDRIEIKEQEIEDVKIELAQAQQLAQEQYEAMKVRIKFMYEEGNSYYLELLFSANGFADMLNKADYIEAISEYDRQKLEEYILNEQLIAACQEELESQEALLQAEKDALLEEQTAKQELVAAAEVDIAQMQQGIDETQETIEQLNAELAAQTATIQALEAQIEAEKKRLAELNKPAVTYDGGAFIWPCPSSKNITSPFGTRKHPILGIERFHNGIDIGAKSGAPILAAYNGTVVSASYTSAMGNYIMIDHGDGLYTIYMHCSALYVSQGQYVSRGDTIAAVGSTGLSTGPHLHFTVRRNGEYVNPLDYVSP
ncbi:MAG: murein hydrolase activator EnvC family protein [Lachnospiraceae bacterium]